MDLSFEHYFVIGLMVAFLLKRLLANKVELIQQYTHVINIFFFLAIAIFLGVQFWMDGIYVGLFALFLGVLAMGKYYYDTSS